MREMVLGLAGLGESKRRNLPFGVVQGGHFITSLATMRFENGVPECPQHSKRQPTPEPEVWPSRSPSLREFKQREPADLQPCDTYM